VPARINNDANCFVLGEKYFGKAQGLANVARDGGGNRAGTGIIMNGQLCSGSHCGAGEFGVIPSATGSWRTMPAASFSSASTTCVVRSLPNEPGQVIGRLCGSFASTASFWEKRSGSSCMPWIRSLSFLGGSVSRSFEFFRETLREPLRDFVYSRAARDLRIEVSDLEHIAIMGAAALCLEGGR